MAPRWFFRGRSQQAAALMAALGSILFLSGCSSVRTEVHPGFALSGTDTYAWRSPPASGSVSSAADGDLLLEQLRQAVDDAFAKYGVRQVDRGEALFLVEARLDVRLKSEAKDPYYSLYVAKRYEEAVLTIELYERETQDRLWLGEGRQRLRYVSRAMSSWTMRFVPTTETRNWRMAEMVARVMDRIPRKPKHL